MRQVTLVTSFTTTGSAREEPITSVQQLEERLATIASSLGDEDYFPGATLRDSDGDTLDVGFVDDKWLLVVTRGQDATEQYCSMGDPTREGSVGIHWEQWTSMRRRWLVPKSDARRALLDWLESGDLSDAVRWTDQTY